MHTPKNQNNHFRTPSPVKDPSPKYQKQSISDDDSLYSLKNEVDILFGKIKGITSSDDSPIPVKKLAKNNHSPIFSTRFSPSINIYKNDDFSTKNQFMNSKPQVNKYSPSSQYQTSTNYTHINSNYQKPQSPKYSPPNYSSKFSPISTQAYDIDNDEPVNDSLSLPHVQFELDENGSPSKNYKNTMFVPSVQFPETNSDQLKLLRQENIQLQAELMKIHNRFRM